MSAHTNRFAVMNSPKMWLDQILKDCGFSFSGITEYSYTKPNRAEAMVGLKIDQPLDPKQSEATELFYIYYGSEEVQIDASTSEPEKLKKMIRLIKQKAAERHRAGKLLQFDDDRMSKESSTGTVGGTTGDENEPSLQIEFTSLHTNFALNPIPASIVQTTGEVKNPSPDCGSDESQEDRSNENIRHADDHFSDGTTETSKRKEDSVKGEGTSNSGESEGLGGSQYSLLKQEITDMEMSYLGVDIIPSDEPFRSTLGEEWESIAREGNKDDHSFRDLN